MIIPSTDVVSVTDSCSTSPLSSPSLEDGMRKWLNQSQSIRDSHAMSSQIIELKKNLEREREREREKEREGALTHRGETIKSPGD